MIFDPSMDQFFYKIRIVYQYKLKEVGMSGFEPPISRPPDAHFNRTKLHPELERKNMKLCLSDIRNRIVLICNFTI